MYYSTLLMMAAYKTALRKRQIHMSNTCAGGASSSADAAATAGQPIFISLTHLHLSLHTHITHGDGKGGHWLVHCTVADATFFEWRVWHTFDVYYTRPRR